MRGRDALQRGPLPLWHQPPVALIQCVRFSKGTLDGFKVQLPGAKEDIRAPSELSLVDVHSWPHFPHEETVNMVMLKRPLL